MEFESLTEKIISCALEVHSILGPGLLERAYEEALAFELKAQHFNVQTQTSIPVRYKSIDLGSAYRVDVLVQGVVVIEVKSVDTLLPVHRAQLLTYLRLLDKPIGLLLNFNVASLKDGGIKRVVNSKNFASSAAQR